jgi:peptidoglycan/LPS O-acetylase OafA/YrhL
MDFVPSQGAIGKFFARVGQSAYWLFALHMPVQIAIAVVFKRLQLQCWPLYMLISTTLALCACFVIRALLPDKLGLIKQN